MSETRDVNMKMYGLNSVRNETIGQAAMFLDKLFSFTNYARQCDLWWVKKC